MSRHEKLDLIRQANPSFQDYYENLIKGLFRTSRNPHGPGPQRGMKAEFVIPACLESLPKHYIDSGQAGVTDRGATFETMTVCKNRVNTTYGGYPLESRIRLIIK